MLQLLQLRGHSSCFNIPSLTGENEIDQKPHWVHTTLQQALQGRAVEINTLTGAKLSGSSDSISTFPSHNILTWFRARLITLQYD